MEFRPCIDIHNGKVKQIVGGSLKDRGDFASENFVSEQDSRFYADMYRKSGIKGGHIILLNSVDSEYYEATKEQAVMALEAYPQGLQVGGGTGISYCSSWFSAGSCFACRSLVSCRQGADFASLSDGFLGIPHGDGRGAVAEADAQP